MNAEILVDLDEHQPIIAFLLFESEEYKFHGRLKYVREDPHATYHETIRSIIISFAEKLEPKKSVAWHADVDLDEAGQIVGLEMIFAAPGLSPEDRPRKSARGRSSQAPSKFHVPYDEL